MPTDPDLVWRTLTAVVIGLAAAVIVIAALGLAYGFLLDYQDRDQSPGNLPIERLRKLGKPPK